MIKIVSVVGARPQFIKAASLSRIFKSNFANKVEEILVHTGQHYDTKMSDVFFNELEIEKPRYNLGVGSGSHAHQTGEALVQLERVLQDENPDAMIVFGDTNATLAGALAASKMKIPIAHVESGLRSFNMKMPEEVNRVITDSLSSFLFCPTEQAVRNLKHLDFDTKKKVSGLNPLVLNVGDVMFDTSLFYRQKASRSILDVLEIKEGQFVLATMHRDFNTDNKERLSTILKALDELSLLIPIILPLHPRTKSKMDEMKIPAPKNLRFIEPVSYLQMLALEDGAKFIVTDSGGVQKEAFFFEKPTLILRHETEWTEIVDNGNAFLCDADTFKIKQAFSYLLENPSFTYPSFYGKGNAAELICKTLVDHLS
ncbi:MAG: UDP-N-acetylglucosamine 2-epimerase (non-hydrolyzing) [Schleiferiaceae bacterium]|jgi:UDP-GlcNAc3NAcA epimerase|nr:UDP-N-acetylglucosamine 2-epimerase (non-hydrolyzing) [Schleiferiaceae bacterium]